MIKIIGPENETDEYLAAKKLGGLISSAWSKVGDNSNNRDEVYIVPSVKAYGQRYRDIDLLVLGSFGNEYTYFFSENPVKKVAIRNICLTIEIKSHDRDIKIKGNKLFVSYKGTIKDVSEQSEGQKYSLTNIFKKSGMKTPYVINLIWLTNFDGSLNLGQNANPHNILTSSSNWNAFVGKIINTNASWLENNGFILQSFVQSEDFRNAVGMFTNSRDVSKPENYGVNFSQLNESSFALFSEIGNLDSQEIPKERNAFIERMHAQFGFLMPPLWDALNLFTKNKMTRDSERQFFVHKPKDSHLGKLRPCYWVCATNSANDNYVEDVQLAFHIGVGPWYTEEASRDEHLAFKLAFFHDFKIQDLDAVKNRIEKERERFKTLIEELHAKDPKYIFYRSYESAKPEVLLLDELLNDYFDLIVEDILGYETCGRPIPRSTEFAKRIEWSEEVDQRVRHKKSFIKMLKEEFDKLIPLYNFYTD